MGEEMRTGYFILRRMTSSLFRRSVKVSTLTLERKRIRPSIPFPEGQGYRVAGADEYQRARAR
jgi:hypothetical protein